MKKRITALIFAFLLLAPCFLVSCDKNEKNTATSGQSVLPTDTEDTSKVYDAPIKDLGGHEFIFYARKINHVQIDTHEIYAEEFNGEKINDAVYSRNLQLEEKYNCSVKMITESDGSYVSKIQDPLLAGDYVCDFLFGSIGHLSKLMQSNLLVDLSSMENMNLSKAWYDEFSMKNITFEGKSFAAIGDAGTLDDRTCWIMYFNKEIVSAYDSELNLYDKVREGKWTIDLMYEIMEATAYDNDGDGTWKPGVDRYGYITEANTNWYHVSACNTTVSIKNADGTYTIPDAPKQEVLDAWSALRKILGTPLREVSWSIKNFKNGLGTFFACNAGTLLEITDASFEYGVLPMPKLNEDQADYYTGVEGFSFFGYAIPTTVGNDPEKHWQKNGFESGAEQAAYFLEAFSYYSMNTLTPAFFDQVCLKQAVVDMDSQEMVVRALKNKVIDPVILFNWGGIEVFGVVGSGETNNVTGSDDSWDTLTSAYESKVKVARNEMEAFLEAIRRTGI